jgi:hypothetical protein
MNKPREKMCLLLVDFLHDLFLTLKMEMMCSSEALVDFDWTTCHIPESIIFQYL